MSIFNKANNNGKHSAGAVRNTAQATPAASAEAAVSAEPAAVDVPKPPGASVQREPLQPVTPQQQPRNEPAAQDETVNFQHYSKPPKSSRPLIIVLCALLAVAIGLLVVFVVIPAFQGNDDWYDPAAQIGNLPGKTQEEIQAELNRIVEEGMFNISIASIIMFEDGASEGAARIENIKANHYNMGVTITLDDGDELIYESKGLAPGQYIENIRLSRDLPAGEYSATALFTAYTQDKLQKVGQAAAKITIVIEQ